MGCIWEGESSPFMAARFRLAKYYNLLRWLLRSGMAGKSKIIFPSYVQMKHPRKKQVVYCEDEIT